MFDTGPKKARSLFAICVMFWSCVLHLEVAAQEWDWVARLHGSNSFVRSVSSDARGDVYIVGQFSGGSSLGTNEITSAGSSDLFVAKLDATGAVRWALSTGGPDGDDLVRAVVSPQGSLFLIGRFTIPASQWNDPTITNTVSNVGLARVDAGKFTWAKQLPTNAAFTGIALVDETVIVLGGSNRVFVQRYDLNGGIQSSFTVGNSSFDPRDVVAGRSGRLFISGRYWGSIDLGTTNLNSRWSNEYFTSGLDSSGRVEWAWSADYWIYANPINGIAPTPDGGVVSVGHWNTGLPQGYAFVVKHSQEGALIWRVDRTGFRKSSYLASGVASDAKGNIHVIGQAEQPFPPYPYSYQRGLWLLTLDAAGTVIRDEFVQSRYQTERNSGLDIHVLPTEDVVIGGQLFGKPKFGGYPIGGEGASSVGNGFVAKRATILPSLQLTQNDAGVLLRWPNTSLPPTVQRSESLTSNSWTDVDATPISTNSGKQISLSLDADRQFFRLKLTNHIVQTPPFMTRYPPRIQNPPPLFLGEPHVFVTVSNTAGLLTFTVWAEDEDQDVLMFEWSNQESGVRLTNGTSVILGRYYDPYPAEYPIYVATLNDPTLFFPQGTNKISVSVSDGVFSVSHQFTLHVITGVSAIDALIQAIEAVTTATEGDPLTEPLDLARQALSAAQYAVARMRIEDFQLLLPESSELSSEQKHTFHTSANAILQGIPE